MEAIAHFGAFPGNPRGVLTATPQEAKVTSPKSKKSVGFGSGPLMGSPSRMGDMQSHGLSMSYSH